MTYLPLLLPLLPVPTQAARASFLRALYAAGWWWDSRRTVERALQVHGVIAGGQWADGYSAMTHVLLTEYGDIMFFAHSDIDYIFRDRDESQPRPTPVNSPAHFLRCGAEIWCAAHADIDWAAEYDGGVSTDSTIVTTNNALTIDEGPF